MDLKRDVIYDIDLELPKDLKQFLLKQEVARAAIMEVFRKHGAILVTSPQLTPKGKSLEVYDKTEHVVKAMTRSGNVVFLPFDLRVPLARYLIRSKTTHLKRCLQFQSEKKSLEAILFYCPCHTFQIKVVCKGKVAEKEASKLRRYFSRQFPLGLKSCVKNI